MCMFMCACVCACVRVYMRACVCAYLRAFVRMGVRAYGRVWECLYEMGKLGNNHIAKVLTVTTLTHLRFINR